LNIDLTPPFTFEREDIEKSVYHSDFVKGLDYYKKDKVIDAEITVLNEDYFVINSEVKGSINYQQEIEVKRDGEAINIEGVCSCPVEYDCKHVVAALLYVQEKISKTPPKSDIPWLDKLVDLSIKEQKEANEPSEYRLNYRLLYNDSGVVEDLKLFRAKLLKSGSYSKGAKVELYDIVRYTYYPKYDYLSEKDRTIMAMIGALMGESWTYSISFKGELGAQIVKMIVETGNAFYADSKVPLTISDITITPTFHWHRDSDNRYILKSNIKRETLIATTPAFMIDTDTNTLHRIEGDIDSQMLLHLLKAPPIEREYLSIFMKKSFDKLPTLPISLPSELIEGKEIDTPPKAKLFIYPDLEESSSYRVSLRYLYEEYEIDIYPQKEVEYLKKDDSILLIKRDLDKEQEYIDRLKEFGFIHKENNDFISTLPKESQSGIEQWRVFLESGINELRDEGWIVEESKWSFEQDILLDVESSKSDTDNWFELSFNVKFADRELPLLPLVTGLLKEFDSVEEIPSMLNLYIGDGQFIRVDSQKVIPILNTLFELYDGSSSDSIKIKPYNAHLIAGLDEISSVQWRGPKDIAILAKQMRDFRGIEPLEPSPNLKAELREYQQRGVSWLGFLHRFRFGGILADDMGLGKTLQTLAFLQRLKYDKKLDRPVLIVMPTSLLGNWKSEIEKFTPDLSYISLYGLQRDEIYEEIENRDIVFTTYQIAQRDSKRISQIEFSYIILDEAQKIKNPRTKITKAVKSFKSQYKLALTGTPMENHLGELWSIFDFLMPGFLGSLPFFKKAYQNPIEKDKNIQIKNRLKNKIKPFMMRRSKDEVLDELPEKIEIMRKVPFGEKQALLYENIRVAMESKVRDEISKKGIARSRIMILDALLKLRQICCDPSLLSISQAKEVKESAKKEMLFELLDELLEEGRKILIFSQFTTMLSIIEEDLKERGINYAKLTGSTKDREAVIDKFKQDDCQLFLISLKAGGVGLNLTEADTVIHYDPWWNPAVENQATDRAYRIGQNKTVFVYKLIIENSIEEKIIKLHESKKAIQDSVYNETKKDEDNAIDAEELIALLSE